MSVNVQVSKPIVKRKGNSDEAQSTGKKQRRWTGQEVTDILEYMKDTIDRNLTIEKPNALVYYGRLIEAKGIANCNASVLRDKVRHLLMKYKEAIKWRDETGQGIRATDGEETFENLMKKRYPYFIESDAVWGTKASIHVPYSTGSTQIGQVVLDPFLTALVPVNSIDSGLEEGEGTDIQIEEVPDTQTDTSTRDTSSPISSSSSQLTEKVKSASKVLFGPRSKTNSQGSSSAREAYAEISHLRTQVAQDKLAMQRDQLELERAKLEIDSQLRREQFEYEKHVRNTELELRKQQVEREHELQLKRLEVEKLKWEVELAKYKSS